MYKKKLVNPTNTPARKAAWETLKKELTVKEIAELIGCSRKTVDVWKRKKKKETAGDLSANSGKTD